MVDINRKLASRPVTKDDLIEFVNRELVPLVERMRIALTGLQGNLIQGEGSPDGVVTADIGAIYQNTTGTVGSLLYAKTTNDVATGWTVLL